MTDDELLLVVENAEKRALGYGNGELSSERATLLNYYNQKPYGNEEEGRSQVVTSEVSDTVEWILPSLLKIFTASDKAVEFEPTGAEDVEGAEQATNACNYVFYKQNNGFLILYSFFKDALIQKNGYVKVYYDKSTKLTKEQYSGLDDLSFQMLVQNPAVKVLAHTESQILITEQPLTVHDVEIEISHEKGKVCIDPLPPEECLVSIDCNSVDPQESPFFAHRSEKTLSYLAEQGYDTSKIEFGGDDNELESSEEWEARRQFDEEEFPDEHSVLDKAMRKVWVTEAYLRVDFDADGKAELRKVLKVGKTILENEEVDVVPIAAITPVVNTHRHFGRSVAEMIADLQLIGSTLMRQVLDNIYMTNTPRQAVLSSQDGSPQANLDDLLTVRPNGVVREYVAGAVRPLTIPFMAKEGLGLLEYMETVGAKRTGITENLAGINADALNQTARGATIIDNNAKARIELIARIFAETGVKQIFKLVLHCLTKYHGRELMVRLNNKFVPMDPRNWDTEMDMTVNVGLGTGNKDQQLMHLQTVAQAQVMAMQAGSPICGWKEVYNVQAKIAENAGFKEVNEFWIDPETVPPQPPKPSPEEQKMQMEAKQAEKKFQLEAQTTQQQMQLTAAESAAKIQLQREEMQAKLQLQRETSMMQAQQQAQQSQMEFGLRKESHDFDMGQKKATNSAEVAPMLQEVTEGLQEAIQSLAQFVVQLHQETQSLKAVVSAPRVVVRDPKTNRVIGSEVVQQ